MRAEIKIFSHECNVNSLIDSLEYFHLQFNFNNNTTVNFIPIKTLIGKRKKIEIKLKFKQSKFS